MRIRKHAKNSSQLHATSSNLKEAAVIPTHLCSLNQSPWDVISTFSPPSSPLPPPPLMEWDIHMQVDGDEFSAVNGSSTNHHRRLPSLCERELEGDGCYSNGGRKNNYKVEEDDDEQVSLCCKTDGKSWRCKREAIIGNSLCEHHLSQVKNYHNHNNAAVANSSKVKNKKKIAEADGNNNNNKRSRRQPKKGSSSSSNPHEFYYYSGFGPCWGKKRAAHDVRTEEEEEAMAMAGDVYEEFDGIEEEGDALIDDEEGDDDDNNGKKRPIRKPIKARSLKSLIM